MSFNINSVALWPQRPPGAWLGEASAGREGQP